MMMLLLAQNKDGGPLGFIVPLIVIIIWIAIGIRRMKETRKWREPPGQSQPREGFHTSQPQGPKPARRTITLEEFTKLAGLESEPPDAGPEEFDAEVFFRPGVPPPPPGPLKPAPPPPSAPRYAPPVSRVHRVVTDAEVKAPARAPVAAKKPVESRFKELESTIKEEISEFVEDIVRPSEKISEPAIAPYKIRARQIAPGIWLNAGTAREGIILSEILQPPLAIRGLKGSRAYRK